MDSDVDQDHETALSRLERSLAVEEKDGTPPGKTERGRRDLKDITCFNCELKGHYASNCPTKSALLCVERRSNFRGESEFPRPG